MKVSYHGHSVVKIEANGKVILIDPFLTGNPKTDLKTEDVKWMQFFYRMDTVIMLEIQ